MSFLTKVVENLQSAAWWADNVPVWLIFSALVSLGVSFVNAMVQKRYRARFEDWKVRIVGRDDKDQSLHWAEVERFLNSNFELWKFTKSVVSGTHDVKLRTADLAQEVGWLQVDQDARRIIIDLEKIPASHAVARANSDLSTA